MKKFDVCSHGGEYQKDGETKVRWINHGAIFEKDGKWSMKLDSIPVGGDGWLKLFEPKPKAQSKVNQGRATGPDRSYFDDDPGF